MPICADPGRGLRLVESQARQPGNRRRLPRHNATGVAVAHFSTESSTHAIAGVRLIDASPSGLGFEAPTPVLVGGFVRVFIGPSPAPSRVGRVARCQALENPPGTPARYRIGLDTGIAAAA